MANHFRDELLTEAVRIGDQLLSNVIKSEHGFSWKTMGIGGGNQEVIWNISEGIYSGVSGIILFLIELHKQTQEDKYLEAVKEGASWVEHYCQNNPTTYYAFFTGRMGAAYLMMQVGKFLKDDTYIEKTIQIAKNCEATLEEPRVIDDLINGTSGTLLGLMHLHAYTNDIELLQLIKKYTDHLIDKAHLGPKGLYWDKSSKNIRGLCGFSHGVAGIGYVFLELGKYFDNEVFYWIAEQAFAYENHFYDEERLNWPDFRKGYYDDTSFKKFRDEYLKGNKAFFTSHGDMSAWCHGAPGIGLSRLRAYELLQKDDYKKDIERAVRQTYNSTVKTNNERQSYTVCHGAGGNAMLFLEAFRQFKEHRYLDYTEQVAQNALNFIRKYKKYIPGFASGHDEDCSLFMGNAGIGYFYLQLLEPDTTPSILKPDVGSTSNLKFEYTLNDVLTKLALNDYSKSTSVVGECNFKMNGNINKALKSEIECKIGELNDERISAIYSYETKKLNFKDSFTSDAYLDIQKVIEQEKNAVLIESENHDMLLSYPLRISESVMLIESDWDYLNINNTKKSEYYLLNIAEAKGITEHELSQFSYLVLKSFENGKTIEEALKEVLAIYEITTDADRKMVEDALINQVKEALISTILIKMD